MEINQTNRGKNFPNPKKKKIFSLVDKRLPLIKEKNHDRTRFKLTLHKNTVILIKLNSSTRNVAHVKHNKGDETGLWNTKKLKNNKIITRENATENQRKEKLLFLLKIRWLWGHEVGHRRRFERELAKATEITRFSALLTESPSPRRWRPPTTKTVEGVARSHARAPSKGKYKPKA